MGAAPSPSASRRASWLLGIAVLGTAVSMAFHLSDEQAFVHLAERAAPRWLGAALVLQVATYVAQAWIWRRVTAAAGSTLSPTAAIDLSFAKLFADQALPSGGLSGSVLVAKSLQRRHIPPSVARAVILLNVASYHLAYIITLTPALVIAGRHGQANAAVTIAALLFIAFAIALSASVLGLLGRDARRVSALTKRVPMARWLVTYISGARRRLLRDGRLLTETIALQIAIVLLDAATLWVLLLALGLVAPPGVVFASFMVSSLVRTMGIVPGGLGAFELSSVLMLRGAGVDTATALSATLLFRGFSFWLPMLPGYWFSRRALGPVHSDDLTGAWSHPRLGSSREVRRRRRCDRAFRLRCPAALDVREHAHGGQNRV
jgi:uncharacterized protein (TIRG00374 family)